MPAEDEVNYRQITMDEAIAMMEEEKNYIILDVRTVAEFDEKHIPGAINIPNETTVSDNVPVGTIFTFTIPSGEVEVHE